MPRARALKEECVHARAREAYTYMRKKTLDICSVCAILMAYGCICSEWRIVRP